MAKLDALEKDLVGENQVEGLFQQAADYEIQDEKAYRLGEMLMAKGLITKDNLTQALQELTHLNKAKSKPRAGQKEGSKIPVNSLKLDHLVNLVGELVTVRARLTQEADTRKDSKLLFLAEEVEQLRAELRESTMNIRMVPIGSIFADYRQVTSKISSDLGIDELFFMVLNVDTIISGDRDELTQ